MVPELYLNFDEILCKPNYKSFVGTTLRTARARRKRRIGRLTSSYRKIIVMVGHKNLSSYFWST